MSEILTSSEIIDALKVFFDKKYDKDIAELLAIDKQSVSQYKQKTQEDIQQKIISLLILRIKNMEQEVEIKTNQTHP